MEKRTGAELVLWVPEPELDLARLAYSFLVERTWDWVDTAAIILACGGDHLAHRGRPPGCCSTRCRTGAGALMAAAPFGIQRWGCFSQALAAAGLG